MISAGKKSEKNNLTSFPSISKLSIVKYRIAQELDDIPHQDINSYPTFATIAKHQNRHL
jgi:hypothetical protein